jgi:hypothetical protein
VLASEAGQEMSDGVLLGGIGVVELAVVPLEDSEVAELERLDDTLDGEDDVAALELELVDVAPEPSFKSLAPQTAGMFTAEPTAFLR